MKRKRILSAVSAVICMAMLGESGYAIEPAEKNSWKIVRSFDLKDVTQSYDLKIGEKDIEYDPNEKCVKVRWGQDDEKKSRDYSIFSEIIGGVDNSNIELNKYKVSPIEGTINVLNLYPGIYDHKDSKGEHIEYLNTNKLEQWIKEPAMIKIVDQSSDDYDVALDIRKGDNGKNESIKYKYVRNKDGDIISNGQGILDSTTEKYNKNITDNDGNTIHKAGEVKRYEKDTEDENGKHKAGDTKVTFVTEVKEYSLDEENENFNKLRKVTCNKLKNVPDTDEDGFYIIPQGKKAEDYNLPRINVITKDVKKFEEEAKDYADKRAKYKEELENLEKELNNDVDKEIYKEKLEELNKLEKDNPLKDKNGYKYDVIVYGTWDVNNNVVPSKNIVKNLYEDFIDSGRGFLAGHDNFGYTRGTENGLNIIREKFGIKVSDSNMSDKGILADEDYEGEKFKEKVFGILGYKVQVAKGGVLVHYPWMIGDEGTELDIPPSHSTNNFAYSDIWMTYGKIGQKNTKILENSTEVSEKLKEHSNFYLTTKNNTAMIQTGHALGQASPDEQKVLVNTIYYLHQLTAKKSAVDYSCEDYAAPKAPTITQFNNGNVSFTNVVDKGTEYGYVVKEHNYDDNKEVKSNEARVTVTSGIRGYLLYTDDNEKTDIKEYIRNSEINSENKDFNTENLNMKNIKVIEKVRKSKDNDEMVDFNNADIKEDDIIDYKLDEKNIKKYVHIAAIDNSGNISETSHLEIKNILDIEPQSNYKEVTKGNEVWADITLNNIYDTNMIFPIHNLNDIFTQRVVVEYDSKILNYTGACTIDKTFRIIGEDCKDGEIALNIKCRGIEGNAENKNKMISLSFDAIEKGEAGLKISEGIFNKTKEEGSGIPVWECQLGKSCVKVN